MTRYEENFRQMIVGLNQTGRSVQGLAKEHDLSEVTIYKWKNLYLPDQSARLTGKEVAELRKENACLNEELETLKRAAAIFPWETQIHSFSLLKDGIRITLFLYYVDY